MATLYLHIGTSKTGTTAIQHFCATNRRALRRRGYCFPRTPIFYPNISGERNGHFLVGEPRKPDGSFATARAEANWRKCMNDLAAQLRRCPNVILSDEAIWNSRTAHHGMWRDLKAEAEARGFDVRIIAYLRRQDLLLSAVWAQWVKYPPQPGAELKWEDLLSWAEEKARLDYYEVLEEIASHFGRERITVRVYDRERFKDGNILSDFLGILGLEMAPDFKAAGERNPSLYGSELEIIRVLNSVPGISPEALQTATRIAIACRTGEESKHKPSMFSEEEARALLRRYEESNRRVALEYLGDASGKLFSEPDDLGPKWEPGSADMYEAIIRFFGTAIFNPPKVRLRTRLRRWVRKQRRKLWELRAARRRG